MIKKHDRIEITNKGVIETGVAYKVGAKKITMVKDGGLLEVSAHPSLFRPSTAPLPTDPPSPMDRWAVTNYADIRGMSEETTAFTAFITADGKRVIRAENTGKGGCNSYHNLPTVTHSRPNPPPGVDFASELDAAAKAWCVAGGSKLSFEHADRWLTWFVNERPYGVTSAAAFAADEKFGEEA